MKPRLTLALVVTFVTSLLLAQDAKRIPAKDAKAQIGKTTVVFGTVAEVHKTDAITRLNFDQPFPRQTFTAVIFPQKFNLFTNLTDLKGKTVEVSGTIADYRGQAQIILTSKDQLKVVEPAKP